MKDLGKNEILKIEEEIISITTEDEIKTYYGVKQESNFIM